MEPNSQAQGEFKPSHLCDAVRRLEPSTPNTASDCFNHSITALKSISEVKNTFVCWFLRSNTYFFLLCKNSSNEKDKHRCILYIQYRNYSKIRNVRRLSVRKKLYKRIQFISGMWIRIDRMRIQIHHSWSMRFRILAGSRTINLKHLLISNSQKYL